MTTAPETTSDLLTATVGQLVAENPDRARIFEAFDIDYCCGGKKPLSLACREKGLDVRHVVAALEASRKEAGAQPDATDWTQASLTDLCDHIQSTHHAYLKTEMPRLIEMGRKVTRAHGPHFAYVADIAATFEACAAELETHMRKEEMILFPMIRQLDQHAGSGGFHCGSIANPIRVMEMEHDSAGNALATIRQLSGGYTLPPEACHTWHAYYDALQRFEQDLHQHVHKENNILFPRAIQRESA